MVVLFFASLSLSAAHLLVGLLLCPFFGQGPFWWGNVLLAFILSLAGGALVEASRLHRLLRPEAFQATLLFIGAAWLSALPLWLTSGARVVLDWDPDAFSAAALTLLLTLGVPGTCLSGIFANLLRAATSSRKRDRPRLPRVLLAFFAGLALGAAGSLPLLLVQDLDIPLVLASLGWFPLVGLGVSVSGWRRLPPALTVLASLPLVLFAPGELDSVEYRDALERTFKMRLGDYYLATAGRRVLAQSELRREYDEVLAAMKGREDSTAAAIRAIAETLENLGAVETSGADLANTLRPIVSPTARRYLMPFLEPLDSISSNGHGRIQLNVKPEFRGRELKTPWAAEAGEAVTTFVMDGDLTLDIERAGSSTELRIGPETISQRSFLELYETHSTPLRLKDVKMFVDAHLLSIVIDNRDDRVLVRARAQGSVGPVVDEVIHVILKAPR